MKKRIRLTLSSCFRLRAHHHHKYVPQCTFRHLSLPAEISRSRIDPFEKCGSARCLYVCTYVFIYVCIYVCIYLYEYVCVYMYYRASFGFHFGSAIVDASGFSVFLAACSRSACEPHTKLIILPSHCEGLPIGKGLRYDCCSEEQQRRLLLARFPRCDCYWEGRWNFRHKGVSLFLRLPSLASFSHCYFFCSVSDLIYSSFTHLRMMCLSLIVGSEHVFLTY